MPSRVAGFSIKKHMSTPISNYREMVRVLIDDSDPDIQLREDAQIDAALRGVLDSGRVIGVIATIDASKSQYSVDATRLLVSPDLTPSVDPLAFVQLTYNAALMFNGGSVLSGAWRTRAFSYVNSNVANADRIMMILSGIYDAQSAGLVAASDYE